MAFLTRPGNRWQTSSMRSSLFVLMRLLYKRLPSLLVAVDPVCSCFACCGCMSLAMTYAYCLRFATNFFPVVRFLLPWMSDFFVIHVTRA